MKRARREEIRSRNRQRYGLMAGFLLLGLGCSGQDAEPAPEKNPLAVTMTPARTARLGSPSSDATPDVRRVNVGPVRFRDVHREAHLEQVYINGERGECLMVETIGGGAGWLDYDADGHWDLYLNQGGDPTVEADRSQPLDAMFRNLGDGTFEDVTSAAGIVDFRYSQGVAIGDYDNDGFDDIYVTNVGPNTLWHNQGDGTFEETTESAGVGDDRWSASAAWYDLDLDGDLDLYVCNYCVYDPRKPLPCPNEKGEPRVCHPRSVAAWPDECYINLGDGTFAPEARQRGLFGEDNRALGVAVADFTNDGLPDIYVCNDTTANSLFVNQGDGTFRDMALLLGCASDANGSFQASMGVAVSDFDRNGFLDLYVCNFYQEYNTLYRNYGTVGFLDETGPLGLHAPTLDRLSFGTVMADFNQDGYEDIFVTSGHIENYPGNPLYHMAPQLFAFDGRRFNDVTKDGGEFFQGKYVGRAVAAGDYDEDGDLDLAVVHVNAPAAILRNESVRGHWLKFLMRGRESNRRGIGCRITVQAGASTHLQELAGGTSYATTRQPALVFGLGDWHAPCTVSIRWPGGRQQVLENVSPDQTLVFDEAESHQGEEPGG